MFSDEEVKRLEEHMEPEFIFTKDMSQRLFARLEAAELALEHFKCYLPMPKLDDCATYKAWRTSAGKDNT